MGAYTGTGCLVVALLTMPKSLYVVFACWVSKCLSNWLQNLLQALDAYCSCAYFSPWVLLYASLCLELSNCALLPCAHLAVCRTGIGRGMMSITIQGRLLAARDLIFSWSTVCRTSDSLAISWCDSIRVHCFAQEASQHVDAFVQKAQTGTPLAE